MPIHESIAAYLDSLAARHRSPHTLRAARQDLSQFVTWWEQREGRLFDPALLLESDLREWQLRRQRDDGAAPRRSTVRSRHCVATAPGR